MTGEVLGKVYGVIARRRGRIVSEEMKEGTAFFTISSLLPVVESFGFADGSTFPHPIEQSLNLFCRNPNENFRSSEPPTRLPRVRLSLPRLSQMLIRCDRYEILDLDPFWVPTTEEELEDLGEKSDRENVAKKYMDDVRLRKVSPLSRFSLLRK